MKKCTACGSETNLMGSLGGVLLCRNCRPQIEMEIGGLRKAGKQVDVTVMARRMYNRLHDNTRTERVNRRNEELNKMAQELEFESLSQMLTAWKNGDITLVVTKNERMRDNNG